MTALLNITSVLETSRAVGISPHLLQVDIAKAYDSVDRGRAWRVLEHMGVASSPLFKFIWSATTRGEVCTTGPRGLDRSFTTSRGIR